MKELLRSNDLVYLSYLTHVLAGEGIEVIVLDGHMAALEGSIGAIPRRVMVADADFLAAVRCLGNTSLTIPG